MVALRQIRHKVAPDSATPVTAEFDFNLGLDEAAVIKAIEYTMTAYAKESGAAGKFYGWLSLDRDVDEASEAIESDDVILLAVVQAEWLTETNGTGLVRGHQYGLYNYPEGVITAENAIMGAVGSPTVSIDFFLCVFYDVIKVTPGQAVGLIARRR
ncbi:hypothetical protein ES705_49744 [subsurface metagenome]|jgi:hypothetical protein